MDTATGWKTYIGAALAAIAGANSVLKWLPDDIQQSILSVGIALAAWGIRSAVGRNHQATEEVKGIAQAVSAQATQAAEVATTREADREAQSQQHARADAAGRCPDRSGGGPAG